MIGLVKLKSIDSIRLLICLALMFVFYFMFGAQNIDRFKAKDIEITKNEEETSIIPSPCNKNVSSKFYSNSTFSVIAVIKTAVNGEIYAKNNNSIENLKECIKKNNVFVENIYGLKSLEKFYILDQYAIYHFVQPKNGSIKFSPYNTLQLGLDPSFEYSLMFFDKNFMIMTMNPDIVRRNTVFIKKNVYPYIFIRVSKH